MSLVQFCSPLLSSTVNEENQVHWLPALDIAEDGAQYIVEVDVAGVRKEDVKVLFDNGILTIEGLRKNESESKEKNYHRIERSYGRFLRHLKLGNNVDAAAIKASYKDGVLTITVPKMERIKPKAIDITVN